MTYLELRNLIVKYLKRKDLDAMVPEFISQGEQMLRDGVEDIAPRGIVNSLALRVREMETVKTYSPGDADVDAATGEPITTITLPADYLEAKYILHGTHDVERATAQTVKQGRLSQGNPRLFLREQSDILFAPMPIGNDDVTLNYYADFTGTLSADGDTNVILTNYSSLYLYSALMAAEPYLYSDERVIVWKSFLTAALRAAIKREVTETRSGSRKTMGRTF